MGKQYEVAGYEVLRIWLLFSSMYSKATLQTGRIAIR